MFWKTFCWHVEQIHFLLFRNFGMMNTKNRVLNERTKFYSLSFPVFCAFVNWVWFGVCGGTTIHIIDESAMIGTIVLRLFSVDAMRSYTSFFFHDVGVTWTSRRYRCCRCYLFISIFIIHRSRQRMKRDVISTLLLLLLFLRFLLLQATIASKICEMRVLSLSICWPILLMFSRVSSEWVEYTCAENLFVLSTIVISVKKHKKLKTFLFDYLNLFSRTSETWKKTKSFNPILSKRWYKANFYFYRTNASQYVLSRRLSN